MEVLPEANPEERQIADLYGHPDYGVTIIEPESPADVRKRDHVPRPEGYLGRAVMKQVSELNSDCNGPYVYKSRMAPSGEAALAVVNN